MPRFALILPDLSIKVYKYVVRRFLLNYLAYDGCGCWRAFRQGRLGEEFYISSQDAFYKKLTDDKMIVITESSPAKTRTDFSTLRWTTSPKDLSLKSSYLDISAHIALRFLYQSSFEEQLEIYTYMVNRYDSMKNLDFQDITTTPPPKVDIYSFL